MCKQINTKSKEELELEKLSIEVKEYRRWWFCKYSFWKAILPSLIIILGSLSIGVISGFFDKQKEKLNSENKIKQKKLDSLSLAITRYEDSLKTMRKVYKKKVFELTKKYEREKHNVDKLNKDEQIKYYKNQCDSLTILINNKKAINYILDEKGNKITDENGKYLIAE
ncbi:MAG: hypothetical protein WC223_13650 [Bacteroidales bacterium]|jgi:hypothetical protein